MKRKPEKGVVVFFVDEELYLALSNLGLEAYTIPLNAPWEDVRTGEMVERVLLSPGTLLF